MAKKKKRKTVKKGAAKKKPKKKKRAPLMEKPDQSVGGTDAPFAVEDDHQPETDFGLPDNEHNGGQGGTEGETEDESEGYF